jgi:hypothetical protein
MKRFLLFLFMTVLLLPLLCQSVLLQINPPRQIYNYFYPAYLDPANPNLQPILFTVTVNNNTDENVSDYEIHLSLYWREYDLIDNAVIKPEEGTDFEVLEAGEVLVINNRDIIVSGAGNNFYNVEGLDLDDILDTSDEFRDLVLQLGYFPDGDYMFEIILLDDSGMEISNPATFTFTIITPTSISLISPGNPFGLAPAAISDTNPYFVWFSNLADSTLKIYEIDDTVDNPDDIALQSDPVFETFIPNTTVFSYPTGSYPLEYGTPYAWQISAGINSPLPEGENSLESNFFIFNIVEENYQNSEDQSLIYFLEQLNIEGLEEIMQLLEAGYSLDVLYLNGEVKSIDYLNELLQKILSGELQISNLEIE